MAKRWEKRAKHAEGKEFADAEDEILKGLIPDQPGVPVPTEAGICREVGKFLRQAAKIRKTREMWYAVRDILNLLTLVVAPEAETVATPEGIAGK